jgi:hypothetical protein
MRPRVIRLIIVFVVAALVTGFARGFSSGSHEARMVNARKVEDAVRKDEERLLRSSGASEEDAKVTNVSCTKTSPHTWKCAVHTEVLGESITTRETWSDR